MKSLRRNTCGLLVLLCAAGLALDACSSSSGSGSSPPATVVVPAGQRVVCSDGTNPPCR